MRAALLFLTSAVFCTTLQAQHGPPPDIPARARGAHRVLVATVLDVNASFARTAHGDQIILSRVVLRVEETLKGPSDAPTVTLDLEGGTVGDLTMGVSDLPALSTGERGVFFLERTAGGSHIPHLRGFGILKLDGGERVRGSGLTLDMIRELARGASR